MSNFLGFESNLIPLGASIEDVKNTFKTILTTYGWQVIAESIQATSLIGAWTTNSNAFDGNPTNTAYTTAALPQSIGVQVAGGFTPTKLTIHGDTVNSTFNARDFSLDYSDNGTAWTTLQSWTGVAWSHTYEKRTFAVAGAASHPYWRITVTARNGGATLSVANLILEDAAGKQVYNGYYIIDLIPPTTETIGGSGAFEFVRMSFTSTNMGIIGLKKWTVGFPQQVIAATATAGAVTVSVTINGHTVSYTGVSTNSANDNLLGLYAAIRDSADSEFVGWDWEVSYPAPQNANDGNLYIFGTSKTVTDQKPTSGINVSVAQHAYPVMPWFMLYDWLAPSWTSCTTELVNGFIYYIQINSRGFAFATKTNAAFYGPSHACYSRNDAALAYMPQDAKYLTPIELICGYDDDATNEDSWGRIGTIWAMASSAYSLVDFHGNNTVSTVSKGIRRHRFMEFLTNTYTADNGSARAGIGVVQL